MMMVAYVGPMSFGLVFAPAIFNANVHCDNVARATGIMKLQPLDFRCKTALMEKILVLYK